MAAAAAPVANGDVCAVEPEGAGAADGTAAAVLTASDVKLSAEASLAATRPRRSQRRPAAYAT